MTANEKLKRLTKIMHNQVYVFARASEISASANNIEEALGMGMASAAINDLAQCLVDDKMLAKMETATQKAFDAATKRRQNDLHSRKA